MIGENECGIELIKLEEIMCFSEREKRLILVGWMKKELVMNAILALLARHKIEPGCFFHSDRGSQYTSNAVKDLLVRNRMRQRFSRVGIPGDNAWSESFFATIDPLDALRNERICPGGYVRIRLLLQ